MLAKIKQLYQDMMQPQPDISAADRLHQARLAATALMVEVMRVDEQKTDAEIETVLLVIEKKFAVTRAEAENILSAATEELSDATDYHQFTSLINADYEMPQKIVMIEFLWQVAFADGELDMYEEHIIRKVAELIYVPHKEFIRTREKVKGQLET